MARTCATRSSRRCRTSSRSRCWARSSSSTWIVAVILRDRRRQMSEVVAARVASGLPRVCRQRRLRRRAVARPSRRVQLHLARRPALTAALRHAAARIARQHILAPRTPGCRTTSTTQAAPGGALLSASQVLNVPNQSSVFFSSAACSARPSRLQASRPRRATIPHHGDGQLSWSRSARCANASDPINSGRGHPCHEQPPP